jgi:hypothetical protein
VGAATANPVVGADDDADADADVEKCDTADEATDDRCQRAGASHTR